MSQRRTSLFSRVAVILTVTSLTASDGVNTDTFAVSSSVSQNAVVGFDVTTLTIDTVITLDRSDVIPLKVMTELNDCDVRVRVVIKLNVSAHDASFRVIESRLELVSMCGADGNTVEKSVFDLTSAKLTDHTKVNYSLSSTRVIN